MKPSLRFPWQSYFDLRRMNFASSRDYSVYPPERLLASVTSLPALGVAVRYVKCAGRGLREGWVQDWIMYFEAWWGVAVVWECKERSERSVKLKASLVAAVSRRTTASLSLLDWIIYLFQPFTGKSGMTKWKHWVIIIRSQGHKIRYCCFIMFLFQQQRLPLT